jgi:hypothetical protein
MPAFLASPITIALTLVVVIERISEYLMTLGTIVVNLILASTDREIPERWVPKEVKILLVSLLNFILYYGLFGFDFVSEPLFQIGVAIEPWKGELLSALLVSGGTNLVHEFFGFFKNNRPG